MRSTALEARWPTHCLTGAAMATSRYIYRARASCLITIPLTAAKATATYASPSYGLYEIGPLDYVDDGPTGIFTKIQSCSMDGTTRAIYSIRWHPKGQEHLGWSIRS